MKSNVGYSTLESAFEAGKETAEKAKQGLKGSKVGMLFTSVDYNQTEVMKGVKSVVGDTPIVGCTVITSYSIHYTKLYDILIMEVQ